MILTPRTVEVRHWHIFCGLGGGARGFNLGTARVGNAHAAFRCLGGVDNDRAAIADFDRLAGVRGTVLDLFSREQYTAFHAHEPPADWREATPDDIRRSAGHERPHIAFGSAPCKGFSGLLSQSRSASAKYQALNQLALRGLWLALEAWKDDPVEFWLFENVPRIQTRGRAVLDQMVALLEAYGYATAETTHDCGELGGLAQSRKRFLLVARHREKVPPFLYEPPKRPLRPVGDVLGALPLPSDPVAGPMHRMRALQWRTWVRLAFVEAGSDWRSLNKLRVAGGHLLDFGIAADVNWHQGVMGVTPWGHASCTVTGRAGVTTGRFAVADPRLDEARNDRLGVRRWKDSAHVVAGDSLPSNGAHAVADPRLGDGPRGSHFSNVYRVVRFADPAGVVTTGRQPSCGGQAVADPRTGLAREPGDHYLTARHYGVVPWDAPAQAVTASAGHDNGKHSVADPRCNWGENAHRNKLKVVDWQRPAPTVIGGTRVDSGALSVADPRCALGVELPVAEAKLVAVIRALDNTWHRPFTTLELAALQSLIDPAEYLELQGTSDTAWRERIGNAVPSDSAMAIASVMGTTLLLAWEGETFALNAAPIWVQPIAIALSVKSEALA